jgi:peptidoglycan/xylan/chitin deacetylase (PgdA/CDA1 family)
LHYRRLGAVALAATAAFALTSCAEPDRGTSSLEQPIASFPATSPTPKPRPKPKPIVPVVPAKLPLDSAHGPAGAMAITGSASVALTFDDGPDPVYTPQMLDVLKKNRAKATFCIVGKRAKAYPGLVRRIVSEGHTLCNHSWAHSMVLGKQPKEDILKDLTLTNKAIRAAAPDAKIKYFRAPGGYFSSRLVGVAKSLGMRSLYWSVDTRDWEFSMYGRGWSMEYHILACIQTQTRRGSIILAHDFRKPDTVAAMAKALPWLTKSVKLIRLPA